MPKSPWINRPPGHHGMRDWNRDGKKDGYDHMLDNMAIQEHKKKYSETKQTTHTQNSYTQNTEPQNTSSGSKQNESSASAIIALIVAILGLILGGYIAVSVLKGTDMIPLFTFIAFVAITGGTSFVALCIWALIDTALNG